MSKAQYNVKSNNGTVVFGFKDYGGQ